MNAGSPSIAIFPLRLGDGGGGQCITYCLDQPFVKHTSRSLKGQEQRANYRAELGWRNMHIRALNQSLAERIQDQSPGAKDAARGKDTKFRIERVKFRQDCQ